MKGSKLYKIRDKNSGSSDYYFDKITAFFKSDKFKPIKNPKKVLFIRNDHLGDMVYSTTVFRELKKHFPNIEICVLATDGNRTIIEKDKNVDKIIEIDLFWRRKNLQALKDYIKVFRKIRKEKFDVGIDLRRSKLNMFFFLFLPIIKNRVSYYNINGGKVFLTHPVFYDEITHVIKEHVRLIERAFDIKIDNIWPKIEVDENDKKLANDFLKKNKVEKYVVFSPGATSDTKRWPEKKFDKLIDLFHKKYPKHKILISGAGNDEGMIKRLSNNRKSFCVPVVNFNLRGMSVIFGKADCVIANDGVATDISWVSGGNLIELSGPVDRKVFGPLRNTKIIYHDIHCNGKTISCPCDWSKPCIKPGGVWCMNLIELNEVMSAINDFINNKKRLKTLK